MSPFLISQISYLVISSESLAVKTYASFIVFACSNSKGMAIYNDKSQTAQSSYAINYLRIYY